MEIQGVAQTAYTQNVVSRNNSTTATESTNHKQKDVAAVYESSVNKPATGSASYPAPNISSTDIARRQSELKAENTITLLQQTFSSQANTFRSSQQRTVIRPFGEMTTEEARDLISEDGYFGVKETSNRLFDLAASIAGGDPEQMQVMKDAITKGFDNAARRWKGDLPDISNKTLDATMAKFDTWFAEFDKK